MNESPEEKAKRYGVPVIPRIPEGQRGDPNPIVAICGACGIEIRKIMYFSCPKDECPVQQKATM